MTIYQWFDRQKPQNLQNGEFDLNLEWTVLLIVIVTCLGNLSKSIEKSIDIIWFFYTSFMSIEYGLLT